jgi:hypothetical protein
MKKNTLCKQCKRQIPVSSWRCPHCEKKLPTIGKKEAIILACVSVFVFAGVVVDIQESSSATIEYKLATINAEKIVAKDDPAVIRFRFLLDALSKKTGDTPEEIADMSVSTQKRLREQYGRDISVLDLMESACTALSGHDASVSYEQLMTSLMVLMSSE